MTSSTEKELLEVSLICKQFYNQISNSPYWLKELLQRYHDNIPPDNFHTDFHRDAAWHQKYETDLLGADKVFSPKLAYFFVTKRSDPRNLRYRERVAINPELVAYRNKNLYVPWLDHDFFRPTESLWRLIKTILICPKWIFAIVMAKKKNNYGLMMDDVNARRISGAFSWLSVSK